MRGSLNIRPANSFYKDLIIFLFFFFLLEHFPVLGYKYTFSDNFKQICCKFAESKIFWKRLGDKMAGMFYEIRGGGIPPPPRLINIGVSSIESAF